MRTTFRHTAPLVVTLLLVAGCPGYSGGFDGGIFDDAGPIETGPTAADVGVKCEYFSDGANPSNTCAAGLSCLIYSYDGLYLPQPPGSAQNFTKHVWEDHFTIYRPDGVDEGYCTLIGTWAQPPNCPVGTQLKLFETNLAVCLRSCSTPADCGRAGYTCDVRFMDISGGTCVRGCAFDFPECVRSGVFQRQPSGGPNGGPVIAMHLNAADLAGSSYCDVGSGVCQGNPGGGLAGPGEPCNDTRDCQVESVCVQGDLLEAVNPALPATSPGFCAQPCKPDAQNPLLGGCRTGFACQAGFTFGHGNPYDPNLEDTNGFLLVNPGTGAFLEAGGFCFPDCQATGGNCDTFPGTTCGAPNTGMFGQSWNQVSMCLVDSLRQ